MTKLPLFVLQFAWPKAMRKGQKKGRRRVPCSLSVMARPAQGRYVAYVRVPGNVEQLSPIVCSEKVEQLSPIVYRPTK
jgi:hypothetical protein